MRRTTRRTNEQVKQEAEHLAESLGLTLEELYHALVKDILLALQRTLRYTNDESLNVLIAIRGSIRTDSNPKLLLFHRR